MIYMVLTDKDRLGPDIWPETSQQAKSIESMMKTIWNTEAMRQQKASGMSDSLLSPDGNEIKHVRVLFWICD